MYDIEYTSPSPFQPQPGLASPISDPDSPGKPIKISPPPPSFIPKCHSPISASKLFSTTTSCTATGGGAELLGTPPSSKSIFPPSSLSAAPPAGTVPFLVLPGEFFVFDLVMRPVRVFCRGVVVVSSKVVLPAFDFLCALTVEEVDGGEVKSQCSSGKLAARRLILRKWPSMAS